MANPRPIGTEFVIIRDPDSYGINHRRRKYTWRVVDHVWSTNDAGATVELLDQLELVGFEYLDDAEADDPT